MAQSSESPKLITAFACVFPILALAIGCSGKATYDSEPTTMVSPSGTFEVTFPDKMRSNKSRGRTTYFCGDPDPSRIGTGIRFRAWEYVGLNDTMKKMIENQGLNALMEQSVTTGYSHKKPIKTRHFEFEGHPAFELVAGPRDGSRNEEYFRELNIYVDSKKTFVFVKVEAKDLESLDLPIAKDFFDSLKISP